MQGTWLIGNGFSTFRLAAAGLSAGRQEYGSAFLTMPIDGIVGLGISGAGERQRQGTDGDLGGRDT